MLILREASTITSNICHNASRIRAYLSPLVCHGIPHGSVRSGAGGYSANLFICMGADAGILKIFCATVGLSHILRLDRPLFGCGSTLPTPQTYSSDTSSYITGISNDTRGVWYIA